MDEPEKRAHERFKVFLNAIVMLDDHPVGVWCSVHDASAGGCLLISSQVFDFPDTVELVIESIDQPIFAKIAWRSGMTAGLQFDWDSCKEGSWVDNDCLDLGAEMVVA